MKTLPPALAAALAGGVTTLATCWRLTTADGRRLGFTDHDRPIAYDGIVHEAASGFTATEAVARADLSVGGLEVDGALTSAALTATDVEAGVWDGATVEIDLVDWTDPAARIRLRDATLGEITCVDGAFRAEIRSLAHRLDETRGRLFQHRCDADLGDVRCGVALARHPATVVERLDARRLRVAGLEAHAAGVFGRGLLRVVSGTAAGRAVEIRTHSVDADGVVLDLWLPLEPAPAVGDALQVTFGCDKRFETCRDRFANAVAFRGFPHIPGNDFLLAHAGAVDTVADGGAYVS